MANAMYQEEKEKELWLPIDPWMMMRLEGAHMTARHEGTLRVWRYKSIRHEVGGGGMRCHLKKTINPPNLSSIESPSS
jgi:hypothetical protein